MAAGVVISQPGQGGKGAELNAMPMPAMQSVVLPQGLPAGLAYLASLNEVIIHQHFDVLEGMGTHCNTSKLLTLSQTSPCFNMYAVQVLKSLWENEKLLVTSNFSCSHSVFYPFGELCAIFIELSLSVWKCQKFCRLG